MKRPYIPFGITQQGRLVPTLLDRATASGRAFAQRHLIADDPSDTNPWDVPPPADLPLRAGWEHERIDPGHAWGLYIAVVVITIACSLLGGCGGGSDWEDEPKADTQPVDCVATPAVCK